MKLVSVCVKLACNSRLCVWGTYQNFQVSALHVNSIWPLHFTVTILNSINLVRDTTEWLWEEFQTVSLLSPSRNRDVYSLLLHTKLTTILQHLSGKIVHSVCKDVLAALGSSCSRSEEWFSSTAKYEQCFPSQPCAGLKELFSEKCVFSFCYLYSISRSWNYSLCSYNKWEIWTTPVNEQLSCLSVKTLTPLEILSAKSGKRFRKGYSTARVSPRLPSIDMLATIHDMDARVVLWRVSLVPYKGASWSARNDPVPPVLVAACTKQRDELPKRTSSMLWPSCYD